MKSRHADLLILLISTIWGLGFVLTKDGFEYLPPITFGGWRLVVATLVLALVGFRKLGSFTLAELKAGLVTGVLLGCAFIFQNVGLEQSSSQKSAFLTALYVVFVPLTGAALYRKLPPRHIMVSLILATFGLGLFSLNERFDLGPGDQWSILCALIFAFQIIAVSHYGKRMDPFRLAFLQFAVAAVVTMVVSVPLEGNRFYVPPAAYYSILLTGVVVTALAFTLQIYAQKYTTPNRAALMMLFEPVSGALFGYLMAGEVLTHRESIGCAVILLSLLLAESGDMPRKLADRLRRFRADS